MYDNKFFLERGPDLMQMLLNVPTYASSNFVKNCEIKSVVIKL